MSKVKKPKFRGAEHKRVYEENQRSWEELKAKHVLRFVAIHHPILRAVTLALTLGLAWLLVRRL